MCQRLFVATHTELPTVRKTKAAPYLELRRADAGGFPRQHFSAQEFPYLYEAAAHAPCGCGFPEEFVGKKPKPAPEDRASLKALGAAIAGAVRGRPRVKMLLSFAGHEDDEVVAGRAVPLSEFTNPEFWLQQGEVITVIKAWQK